jgi:hypothetical protein
MMMLAIVQAIVLIVDRFDLSFLHFNWRISVHSLLFAVPVLVKGRLK